MIESHVRRPLTSLSFCGKVSTRNWEGPTCWDIEDRERSSCVACKMLAMRYLARPIKEPHPFAGRKRKK